MIYAHSLRYFNKYVKLNNIVSSIEYIVKKGKEKKYKKMADKETVSSKER